MMLTAEAPALIIFGGWDVYRRSQQLPFPPVGAGALMKAQSRLFALTEPAASGRAPMASADLDGIREASAGLVDVIRSFCGDELAGFACGRDGSVAA